MCPYEIKFLQTAETVSSGTVPSENKYKCECLSTPLTYHQTHGEVGAVWLKRKSRLVYSLNLHLNHVLNDTNKDSFDTKNESK